MSRRITSLLRCKGAGALERGHYNCLVGDTLIICNEELTQQRRQRLRKRHVMSLRKQIRGSVSHFSVQYSSNVGKFSGVEF